MPDISIGGILSLAPVASTGPNGIALVNALTTLLSYTAPNDGQLHRCIIFGWLNVTGNQTGGQIQVNCTNPNFGGPNLIIAAGVIGLHALGFGAGGLNPGAVSLLLFPGQTVIVSQSAQSAGAATFYGELWAS